MPVSHIQTYTGCFFNEPIVPKKLIINKIHPIIIGNESIGGNSQYSLPPKMPKHYEERIASIEITKIINCIFNKKGKRNFFPLSS